MKNISEKTFRENQNSIFFAPQLFFRKSCHLWNEVEKYGGAREATDDNVIRCMRFACWEINTHSAYVIFIAFPRQQWCRERASYYVTRTLPLLFNDYFNKHKLPLLHFLQTCHISTIWFCNALRVINFADLWAAIVVCFEKICGLQR